MGDALTPGAAATIGYLRLLRRNEAVRRVWAAQVVSELGDWLNLVALFQIITLHSGKASAAGWVLIIQTIPWIVWSPVAGVVADRFDRRSIMIGSDLLRAAVVLGFLTIDRPDRLWLLYVIAAAQFSFTAFFEPARSALLPALASGQELVTANALGNVTWSIMLAIGGAIGGLVAGLMGTGTAFVVDSASFVLSAALLVGLPRRSPRHEHSHSSASPHQAVDQPVPHPERASDYGVGVALRELRSRPRLLAVLLVKSGLTLSGGGLWLLTLVYGQRVFPIGEQGAISVGLFYGVHGLGAVLGATGAGRYFRGGELRPVLAILGAFALRAVFFLMLGAAPTMPLALLAVVGIAACGSVLWVVSTTLLQILSTDQMRGRLFALDFGSLTVALATSLWSTGFALDRWSMPPQKASYATGGVAFLVSAMWLLAVSGWRGWGRREPHLISRSE